MADALITLAAGTQEVEEPPPTSVREMEEVVEGMTSLSLQAFVENDLWDELGEEMEWNGEGDVAVIWVVLLVVLFFI